LEAVVLFFCGEKRRRVEGEEYEEVLLLWSYPQEPFLVNPSLIWLIRQVDACCLFV
jgi:hypothetical protein